MWNSHLLRGTSFRRTSSGALKCIAFSFTLPISTHRLLHNFLTAASYVDANPVTMSNLGPLTTTYIPGPGCDDTLYGKIYSSMSVRDKYHSLGQTETTSCYPSSFTAPNNWYSPGICPSAWSSACGNLISTDSTTETRVTCCPSGYICATTTDSPWNTFSCSRLYVEPVKVIVPQADGTKTNYMETTLPASVLAYADAVQVRYQTTDLPILTSNLAVGLSSVAPTSSGIQSHSSVLPSRSSDNVKDTSTPATDEKKQEYKGGLSPGAYVGIGFAVAAVLVMTLCAILWTVRRRRRRSLVVKETDSSNSRHGNNVPEMDVSRPFPEMSVPSQVWEAGQRDAGEVRGDTVMPAELGSRPRIHQLA